MSTLKEQVPRGPVRGMMIGLPISAALWVLIGVAGFLLGKMFG